MIMYYNTMGRVSLTNDYFAELVSEIAKNCYGVAGMAPGSRSDSLKSLILGKDFREKGVKVHRVRNEVETCTGLKVARVNVHVDGMIGD